MRGLSKSIRQYVRSISALDLGRKSPAEDRGGDQHQVGLDHPQEQPVGVVLDEAQFRAALLADQTLAATADVVVEDVDVIHFVAVRPELVLDPPKRLGGVAVASGAAQNGHVRMIRAS